MGTARAGSRPWLKAWSLDHRSPIRSTQRSSPHETPLDICAVKHTLEARQAGSPDYRALEKLINRSNFSAIAVNLQAIPPELLSEPGERVKGHSVEYSCCGCFDYFTAMKGTLTALLRACVGFFCRSQGGCLSEWKHSNPILPRNRSRGFQLMDAVHPMTARSNSRTSHTCKNNKNKNKNRSIWDYIVARRRMLSKYVHPPARQMHWSNTPAYRK